VTDNTAYPVSFSVAYPDQPLSRASTAARPLVAIPIVIVALFLQGATMPSTFESLGWSVSVALTAGGAVTIPVGLMLIFRQKYPRWWWWWNVELLRFTNRIVVYLMLMTDRYPSTDAAQSVSLDLPYPEEATLSRALPLIKWALLTPHYVVLALLLLGLPIAFVGAWVSILFTGRYPRGLFEYVESVLRWINRLSAYGMILVTDKYPPFRLDN
jgi:hypothetical protein